MYKNTKAFLRTTHQRLRNKKAPSFCKKSIHQTIRIIACTTLHLYELERDSKQKIRECAGVKSLRHRSALDSQHHG